MASLHCTIVTPERAVLEEEASLVVVPAHDGEIGILPGHARLIAKLGVGVLRVKTAAGMLQMVVEGGFVQVADNRVSVLTDFVSEVGDVDVDEAERRVAELRTQSRGEEFAAAKNRALVMKRVKERFARTR